MTRPTALRAPIAATAVDVIRQTVREWRTHHAGLQAALHRRRQALEHALPEPLRGRRPKALGALTRELDGETPLPAAVHVLRAVGLYGAVPAPQGRIEREDAVAAARQRDSHRLLASRQGLEG